MAAIYTPQSLAPGSSSSEAAQPVTCANPNATPQVHVQVDAKLGPNKAATTHPFSGNYLSMNIDDKVRQDYVPTLNSQYVDYLKALHPALLRWPAGYYGQHYTFNPNNTTSGVVSPVDGSAIDPNNVMTPDLIDAFVALCRAVGAEPYLALNLDTGTPANAAQFVNYVNVQKHYNVTWWQIGNEPDVNGLDATHNPNNYATGFLQMASAVKAVDGNIKLVGGEIMTGGDILAYPPMTDWLSPILQGTVSAPMDAIAWHYYPINSSSTDPNSSAYPSDQHLLQEDCSDWPPACMDYTTKIYPVLEQRRDAYNKGTEIWVDEFAEDSGQLNASGLGDRVVGALWAADDLGRMAESGADKVMHFLFKGEAEHKYTLIDENNNPRPEYYVHWLYAQQFGDQLVSSSTDDDANVSVHAATRASDGTLHVLLVNKNSSAEVVSVQIDNFTAKSSNQYSLVGTSYDADTMALNGQSLDPNTVTQGPSAIAALPGPGSACMQQGLTLPALSVTMLVLSPTK